MHFKSGIDRESPFTPGKAVPPHLFRGRKSSIQKILRYYSNACNNNVQHFFLTGKAYTGKTSLAKFVTQYLEHNHDALGIYISNKSIHTLEELVTSIFEAFLNKIDKNFFEKCFEGLFGKIENIEFKETEIRFRPDDETLKSLVGSFHYI